MKLPPIALGGGPGRAVRAALTRPVFFVSSPQASGARCDEQMTMFAFAAVLVAVTVLAAGLEVSV
jgi:hypothetical protein